VLEVERVGASLHPTIPSTARGFLEYNLRSSWACRRQTIRGGFVRRVIVSEFVSLDGVVEDPSWTLVRQRGAAVIQV